MKRLIVFFGSALGVAGTVLILADAAAAGALAVAGAAACLAILATVTWQVDEDDAGTRSAPTAPRTR
jgi:hypothetical protein